MIRFSLLALVAFIAPLHAAELPTEPLIIETADAEHSFEVELALTPEQQRVGLMFRKEMAPDRGMLFVYSGEDERFMWMKNTVLSLDMLFIAADGRVASIVEDAEPYSTDIIRSGAAAKAVLELNAGSVDRYGLAVGDRVRSEALGTR